MHTEQEGLSESGIQDGVCSMVRLSVGKLNPVAMKGEKTMFSLSLSLPLPLPPKKHHNITILMVHISMFSCHSEFALCHHFKEGPHNNSVYWQSEKPLEVFPDI